MRHDPTAQLADVTAKMSKVDVGEKAAPPAIEMTAHEADDGRTLEDRLGDSSPELVSTLAAMLSQQLDRARGDVVLALGPHNLGERTIASLFELSPGSTTTDGEAIPNVKVEAIVATLRAAVAEIHAEATVLWPAAEGKVESDFGLESARNDEVATKRWGCTGIRILIRRIPNTAEDLTELRVAVVGNVDAGKSTLLGVLTKGRLDDGRGRVRGALLPPATGSNSAVRRPESPCSGTSTRSSRGERRPLASRSSVSMSTATRSPTRRRTGLSGQSDSSSAGTRSARRLRRSSPSSTSLATLATSRRPSLA